MIQVLWDTMPCHRVSSSQRFERSGDASSMGMTCWTTQCDIPEDLSSPCLLDMFKLWVQGCYYIDVNTQWYYCCTATARRRRHQPRPATLKQPRNFGRWVRSWLGWVTGTPSLLLTTHHCPARLHTLCGWRVVALHVVDIHHMWQAVPVTFIATVILILHSEDPASWYILTIKPTRWINSSDLSLE